MLAVDTLADSAIVAIAVDPSIGCITEDYLKEDCSNPSTKDYLTDFDRFYYFGRS